MGMSGGSWGLVGMIGDQWGLVGISWDYCGLVGIILWDVFPPRSYPPRSRRDLGGHYMGRVPTRLSHTVGSRAE